MPPMRHGDRYAMPASVQLPRPVKKARLRPLWSANRPANRRLHSATTEKVPITNPTVRSEPPKSCRTWGARAGRTVPKPRKPRNVAAIRHQKRPPSDVDDPISHHCTDTLTSTDSVEDARGARTRACRVHTHVNAFDYP